MIFTKTRLSLVNLKSFASTQNRVRLAIFIMHYSKSAKNVTQVLRHTLRWQLCASSAKRMHVARMVRPILVQATYAFTIRLSSPYAVLTKKRAPGMKSANCRLMCSSSLVKNQNKPRPASIKVGKTSLGIVTVPRATKASSVHTVQRVTGKTLTRIAVMSAWNKTFSCNLSTSIAC